VTEGEFIQSIDCCFPYGNKRRWTKLIEIGANISPNSAFMILHEICRPPKSAQVVEAQLSEILEAWLSSFSHPLVEVMLPIAKTVIGGNQISVEESVKAMRVVAPYEDQYNALAILYFACDDDSGEAHESYQEVVRNWRARA